MELRPASHRKISDLIGKGVDIPNPLTLDIGDEVPVENIYLENRLPCESVFMPCGDAGAMRNYLENRRPCESVFMPCGDAGAMRNCVQDECIGREGIKPSPTSGGHIGP